MYAQLKGTQTLKFILRAVIPIKDELIGLIGEKNIRNIHVLNNNVNKYNFEQGT